MSKGRHVLLLNPDTVVAEDTFDRILEFADSKMISMHSVLN
jgi:GT2 family glycosyltransferase